MRRQRWREDADRGDEVDLRCHQRRPQLVQFLSLLTKQIRVESSALF